jgi:hypothetical protein
MKSKKTSASVARHVDERPLPDRRAFERVGLPATAFALDQTGNELGRVEEISGGGLRLNPASPFARLALMKGMQLVVTVVEPATGNLTDMSVEVCYVRSQHIGLRFR